MPVPGAFVVQWWRQWADGEVSAAGCKCLGACADRWAELDAAIRRILESAS